MQSLYPALIASVALIVMCQVGGILLPNDTRLLCTMTLSACSCVLVVLIYFLDPDATIGAWFLLLAVVTFFITASWHRALSLQSDVRVGLTALVAGIVEIRIEVWTPIVHLRAAQMMMVAACATAVVLTVFTNDTSERLKASSLCFLPFICRAVFFQADETGWRLFSTPTWIHIANTFWITVTCVALLDLLQRCWRDLFPMGQLEQTSLCLTRKRVLEHNE